MVCLKLSLPEDTALYDGFVNHPHVMRVLALSGGQGLTFVRVPAQPNPVFLHLPVSLCLTDWGNIMHPPCPTKRAYGKPKCARV
jgi:hypothetical protein